MIFMLYWNLIFDVFLISAGCIIEHEFPEQNKLNWFEPAMNTVLPQFHIKAMPVR
jgi:hypothetical protein